jgi:hypothetical protein
MSAALAVRTSLIHPLWFRSAVPFHIFTRCESMAANCKLVTREGRSLQTNLWHLRAIRSFRLTAATDALRTTLSTFQLGHRTCSKERRTCPTCSSHRALFIGCCNCYAIVLWKSSEKIHHRKGEGIHTDGRTCYVLEKYLLTAVHSLHH